jgi:general secretion pathway protein J
VRFRYRGLDEENRLGEWQDRWETAELLPLQVKVEVQGADGTRWPDLVVTLARSEGGAGGGLLPPGGAL